MSEEHEDTVIFLPTTEKAFDELIEKLVKYYELPSASHAAAVVANRIQHLPPEQATTTLKYLGHCILKNIAYQVARGKAQVLEHKEQVDLIVAELASNPNNQQARDALTKSALGGSQYAQEALSRLEPTAAQDNVMELVRSTPPQENAAGAVLPGPA